MSKLKNIAFIIFASATMSGCKQAYDPPVIAGNNNYLVVEGLINSGQDSTFIKLSRTVNLSGSVKTKPELYATVTVESDQNNSYSLQEIGNGLYSSANLNLPGTAKYRLRIKTLAGKIYLSDFVAAKNTPGIDSISYHVQNGGVQFYVDSHDPQNNTRYYRWDFEETWKYLSYNQSILKLGADSLPTFRLPFINSSDDVYDCYKNGQSQQVLLGSSAKLSQDVIAKQPIEFVIPESGKLSHGYSILLRQYALTSDAFTYWQILKKNTEQLGSIFDAQPSSLQGNIHCTTNPTEPVIGYVSTSSVKTKRIYVDPTAILLGFPYYIPPPSADECISGFIRIAPQETFKDRLVRTVGNGDTVLLAAVQPANSPVIGYSYIQKDCADCRAKAPFGTNVKPAFFPSY